MIVRTIRRFNKFIPIEVTLATFNLVYTVKGTNWLMRHSKVIYALYDEAEISNISLSKTFNFLCLRVVTF